VPLPDIDPLGYGAAFASQARENLDVVTIIGSNRSYQILEVELLRAGVAQTGPVARSMLGLDHPF